MKIYKTLKSIKKIFAGDKSNDRYSSLRFSHVDTKGERIAAMTFDDGPCGIICTEGMKLTDFIRETLESYNFKATFDIIGSTEENYPDKPGKLGSFRWSGVCYDHYPRFEEDKIGGAVNNPDIIRRLIDGGFELANHGYRHIACGKQGFPYYGRAFFSQYNDVITDYKRLHDYIYKNFDYNMVGARPPHYAETIGGDKTVFDVYRELGYNYYFASFDLGGWEKNETSGNMVKKLKKALEENPDSLCGKVIYQKDGLSMSCDMPIYEALPLQLDLLFSHGYEIITVSELLKRFA